MDLESKTKDICEMKEMLVSAMKTELAKGIGAVNTRELGEVADIIKDLAETEKSCYEAAYYKSVVAAMEEAGEEEKPYGYRPPRVKGDIWMKPYVDQEPYVDDYLSNERMGYPMHRTQSGRFKSENNHGGSVSGGNPRYGYAYQKYQDSRRDYNDTKSETDKQEMNLHAQEHVADTMSTIRDIWKTADPELRKRMKTDLTNLANELN